MSFTQCRQTAGFGYVCSNLSNMSLITEKATRTYRVAVVVSCSGTNSRCAACRKRQTYLVATLCDHDSSNAARSQVVKASVPTVLFDLDHVAHFRLRVLDDSARNHLQKLPQSTLLHFWKLLQIYLAAEQNRFLRVPVPTQNGDGQARRSHFRLCSCSASGGIRVRSRWQSRRTLCLRRAGRGVRVHRVAILAHCVVKGGKKASNLLPHSGAVEIRIKFICVFRQVTYSSQLVPTLHNVTTSAKSSDTPCACA